MKILSLRIRNIRSIDELELDEIPDVVILAGPNGSGKSSVLDAIRAFKAAHATAVTDFPNEAGQPMNYQFGNVAADYPSLVAMDAEEGSVEATIEVSDEERTALGLPSSTLTGKVTFRGAVPAPALSGDDSQHLRNLFAQFSSAMEHIPASRRFNPREVTSLNFASSATAEERLRWSDQTAEKFQRFKADLFMWHYLDLQERPEGKTRIDAIADVVNGFLVDKKFLGVRVAQGQAPSFAVETSRGIHEIDH